MSTKNISPKSGEIKPEADKAKRVFRAAVECIRRVDETLKQKKAYRDVFLPDAINMRSRLQDYCERLMFYDPLEYGRKAEELLWRKVYYDIIQLMKHNRKQMRPNSSLEGAFRTHLTSAMGYYHHLLFKLQCEFNLRLEGVIDFFRILEPRSHKKPHQLKKNEPEMEVQLWAEKACHRCLIYLGDLARYQQEYDGIRSCLLSQRYYYSALQLSPDIGMPHNQLGTLAGTSNYNLDAAYHYLRCLTCWAMFDGAHGNLTRLFEKNRRRYAEQASVSPVDHTRDHQRSKDIKRFIVRFLHLVDIFLVSKHKPDSRELQECCQNALNDLNMCMFYQPPHVTHPDSESETNSNEEKMAYLSDNIVFKVVVICIMINYQLQKAGNKQVTAAIAFSLALFSHILNHVVIRLQTALCELENPSRPVQPENKNEKLIDTTTDATDEESSAVKTNNDCETDDTERGRASSQEKMDEDTKSAKPGIVKKQRRKLQMLRRRRRRRRDSESTSESNQSAFSGDDSDLSEGEISQVLAGFGKNKSARKLVIASEHTRGSDSESDEEVVGYMNHSGSSDSDSDDLMVSQELRPGFSSGSPDDGHGGPDIDIMQKLSTLNALSSSITSPGVNGVTQGKNLLDPTEYLKDLSVDLASDTSALFSSSTLFPGLFRAGPDIDIQSADLKAVAQGTKEVRVPPGFEKTSEMQHVKEITEKLNNFVIETDTDTTSMPTDTDNSSLPTESELETETDHESVDSVIDKAELEQRRLDRLLRVVGREGLLLAIKVYCDWLRVHPHIIATCAQSSQSLWSRLSVLLNFFPLEDDLAKPEICNSIPLLDIVRKCSLSPFKPTQPLPEDVHLRMFPPLEDAHKPLVFDECSQISLSQEQEAVVRICSLRKFGHFISKMKSIQFMYNWERGVFYGPLQMAAMKDPAATQEQMVDAESRRNQLMKDMAQLRLQAEVSQLEGSLQSGDQPSFPPYLVPDGSALCEDLVQMKQLVSSSRFIVIIPLAVVDQLDFLKKESVGAREAIRWLEAEFRKGNRFVRAQKNHEKITSIPHKNLKKRDKDAWRFRQILDCCKYFTQQSADADAKGLVCVLIGHHPTDPELSERVKQAIASAQLEGVSVQNTMDFHNKWKDGLKTSKG